MLTHVYMIRHAESFFVFGEERTRGLSDEGVRMAQHAAELLKEVELAAVVSSSYTRAIQTVQAIADQRGMPVKAYEELRERPIKGLVYKAPWEELEQAIERSFSDWDYAMAGGETTRQAQQRSIPLLEELLEQYKGQAFAIGTHGNIMAIMLSYYDQQYGYAFWKSTSMPDIYRLAYEGKRLIHVERIWASPAALI